MKKQTLAFVLITFTISWIEQYFIIKGDGIQNPARAFALMWTPGLVGIACSLFFNRSVNPLALKVPSLKSLGISYFTPVLAAILVIFLIVICGITEFQFSPALIEKKGGLSAALVAVLVMAPTLGMIAPIVSGLGEEIGWRGYLHTQLENLSANHRYLITGLIWSLWHWPLIIFGDYATSNIPAINVLFFTVAMTSLSFLMGYLRDTAKSVFPAAVIHGSHNMWILGISPVFFTSTQLTPYYAGESGMFCALLYLLLAFWIVRKTSSKMA